MTGPVTATAERYRILVVDDEADIRTIIRMSLASQFEVVEANNGLDAMLKLPKYQPDLAIIDVMMPLMNGLELAERIRGTAGYEQMPIIALSALDSTEDIKKGYQSGANVYLTKPFDPDRVVKNIKLSLDGKGHRPKSMSIEDIHAQEKRLAERTKKALETRSSSVPKLDHVSSRNRTPTEDDDPIGDLPTPRAITPDEPTPMPPPPSRSLPSGTNRVYGAGGPRSSGANPLSPPSAAPAPPSLMPPSAQDFSNSKVVKSFMQKEIERRSHEEVPKLDDLQQGGGHAGRKQHKPGEIPRSPSGTPARVLLVDDEADFLTIARMALESEGYEVVTATNGFDALNKIPAVQPDIYVVDGMMPKMSGYQLIEMLQGAVDTMEKPIIFVSAKGSDKDRKMMERKGVKHYLVKPFDPRELIEVLGEVTNHAWFQVEDKKNDIATLLQVEGKKKERDEDMQEKKRRWASFGEIEKFLKAHKNEDAFEHGTGKKE